jgi:hypothetical protein
MEDFESSPPPQAVSTAAMAKAGINRISFSVISAPLQFSASVDEVRQALALTLT